MSSSLHNQTIETTRKLIQIDGFKQILEECIQSESKFKNITPSRDPVIHLWHCFRFGNGLCLLLNAYRPGTVPDVNSISAGMKNPNLAKVNVYHFILGCQNVGIGNADSLFSISELYKEDIGGYVKVLGIVNEILDRIEREGIINFQTKRSSSKEQQKQQPPALTPRRDSHSNSQATNHKYFQSSASMRDKVIFELVETERKYVADLERLQKFMWDLIGAEAVSKTVITNIFCNVNVLVDFERAFLLALEDESNLPSEKQRFGKIFLKNATGFNVYSVFCANYQNALQTITTHKEELERMKGGIEPTRELPSYLIKPIQRICKFPLLLRELLKHTPDDQKKLIEELKEAQKAMEAVTDKINEANRREENRQVTEELVNNVDDWKGLRVQDFGDLLLHGKMVMQKGDLEKEVHMFLFERILICCKEVKKESKNKTLSIIRRSLSSSSSANSSPQYILKGRVAVCGIEGIVASSRNNNYDLKIFFKDNDTGEMECVTLRFIHEEPLQKWHKELESLLDWHKRRSAPVNSNSRRTKDTTGNKNSPQSRRRTATTDEKAKPPPLNTRISRDSTDRNLKTPERRQFNSNHVSPLASPAPRQSKISLSTNESNGSPIINLLESPPKLHKFDNLEKLLDDFESKLETGYYNDDEDPSKLDHADIPPPAPLVSSNSSRTVDKSSIPLARKIPRPPAGPAPIPSQSIKIKIHTENDIFMLLLVKPEMKLEDLQAKIQEKAGKMSQKLRYQDDDGDFISIFGQDDLNLALRLCLARGVMNLYT